VGDGLPDSLSPGEQVTLSDRGGGAYGVVQVRPLTTEPEASPAPRDATEEYMMSSPDNRHPAMTAPEGTVRFSLWANPQEGARLKLENNLGRNIIYSAELVRRGARAPEATTICSVADGSAAYELWPDDVTAIRITGFYSVPPGTGQVCGYPERGELSAPPPTVEMMPAPSGGK
jgi:hypothetical protein